MVLDVHGAAGVVIGRMMFGHAIPPKVKKRIANGDYSKHRALARACKIRQQSSILAPGFGSAGGDSRVSVSVNDRITLLAHFGTL
jgi:hypothetical protein